MGENTLSKDDPKTTTESPADPVGPTADGPAENQLQKDPEPALDAADMARDARHDGVAGALQVRESPPTENDAQNTSDGDIHQTIAKLEVVQHQLRRLHEAFEAKLKYDAHKEKIIDQLHEELQEYRKDILRQHQHSFVTDVIKIIDDIRKLTSHYQSIDPGEWSPVKLLEHLEQIPSDLEDLFLVRGIVPFRQATPTFDPARQRIAKKVPTADPLQDKCVASSLRPGYEDQGRVIRPELVAVYDYDSSEAQTAENSPDE
jgi:molecular chaperone GrpE